MPSKQPQTAEEKIAYLKKAYEGYKKDMEALLAKLEKLSKEAKKI